MEEQKNQTIETEQQESKQENNDVEQMTMEADSGNNASDSKEVDDNKIMAIIGYIIPLLFFIPLLDNEKKKIPFVKFHANQQLNLLLAGFIVSTLGGIIPVLGWFIILPLGMIASLVLAVIGVINASKGEMKELPLIGGFQLIK